MTELSRYTWSQANILGLATARGFKAIGVKDSTVRHWASDGLITAVGKGPGGAHLYKIDEVSEVADRPRRKPGRRPRSGTLRNDQESPTLGSR